MPDRILVTGANRGIGLELVHQYLADGAEVIAACRDPERAPALNDLAGRTGGRLTVQPLEVTNSAHIANLRAVVGSGPLDILFNNAGVYGQKNGGFGRTDAGIWIETFRINVIAPMQIMEALADAVAAGRRRLIVNMTSKMGSMADNSSGGSYVYRSSKAALNAITRSAAVDLAERGIIVIAMHPGWVQTEMGGPHALISAAQSVSGIRRVLDRLTIADSGRFYGYDGKEILW
jgi:NAD(P)-dependent dehydrogenase (short-subunit alcohol dehydrogenase family)